MNSTYELIRCIGTPFDSSRPASFNHQCESLYELAFQNRIGLLYLVNAINFENIDLLKEKYENLLRRRQMTDKVIHDLAILLNEIAPREYAIFKSFRPYPSTPNDTDVIFFCGPSRFRDILQILKTKGYFFHEWAPMQTTLCDPSGKGKTGKGKHGGIYYIDFYREISTDYFAYINKRNLLPYLTSVTLRGSLVTTLSKEVELAIILFHNVFPERTFQLEHFYIPLFYFNDKKFKYEKFIKFVKSNGFSTALSANLTLINHIHRKIFGFSPKPISDLINEFGYNHRELKRFIKNDSMTPYLFSPLTFWNVFIRKLSDPFSLLSIFNQILHMANPLFFLDVINSIHNRFSETGTYHQE